MNREAIIYLFDCSIILIMYWVFQLVLNYPYFISIVYFLLFLSPNSIFPTYLYKRDLGLIFFILIVLFPRYIFPNFLFDFSCFIIAPYWNRINSSYFKVIFQSLIYHYFLILLDHLLLKFIIMSILILTVGVLR